MSRRPSPKPDAAPGPRAATTVAGRRAWSLLAAAFLLGYAAVLLVTWRQRAARRELESVVPITRLEPAAEAPARPREP